MKLSDKINESKEYIVGELINIMDETYIFSPEQYQRWIESIRLFKGRKGVRYK